MRTQLMLLMVVVLSGCVTDEPPQITEEIELDYRITSTSGGSGGGSWWEKEWLTVNYSNAEYRMLLSAGGYTISRVDGSTSGGTKYIQPDYIKFDSISSIRKIKVNVTYWDSDVYNISHNNVTLNLWKVEKEIQYPTRLWKTSNYLLIKHACLFNREASDPFITPVECIEQSLGCIDHNCFCEHAGLSYSRKSCLDEYWRLN